MTNKAALSAIALLVLLMPFTAEAREHRRARPRSVAVDNEIAALLTRVRTEFDVPGMAGAIVTGDGLLGVAAVGVRKRGTDVAVTLNDKWHLGSNTKAMTSTLVGRLVERGVLRWSTTLFEAFPKLSHGFHADLKNVTLMFLLTHHSGLKANLDIPAYLGQDAPRERLRAVEHELASPPQLMPGTTALYSNLGYLIAGAMVENVTGASWRQNMRKHVFGPLGMKTAGFGGLGTPGEIDQPWPHFEDGKPVEGNGPLVDNPPVMGPAGRVHCTIQDWAKYAADVLRGARGARGDKALLKPATYVMLHTPPFGDDHAYGWILAKRDWGGGAVMNHCGSNTMNYSNAWIAPKRDFAVLVCLNQGGDVAFKASDAVAAGLIGIANARR